MLPNFISSGCDANVFFKKTVHHWPSQREILSIPHEKVSLKKNDT